MFRQNTVSGNNIDIHLWQFFDEVAAPETLAAGCWHHALHMLSVPVSKRDHVHMYQDPGS